MNIPEHISESLETIFGFKILKFFDADADSGSGIIFVMYSQWADFFLSQKQHNFLSLFGRKSFLRVGNTVILRRGVFIFLLLLNYIIFQALMWLSCGL
jgi:hypothetical protein